MLNISNSSVRLHIPKGKYKTLVEVENKVSSRVLRRLLYVTSIILLIILFLPWTQNIRTTGYITTLTPQQKPQKINSLIGGQIETWYVKEGDYIAKGDTILKIKESKDAYFDSDLLTRTLQQIELKRQAILNYNQKINTQEEQLLILNNQRQLKLNQTANKLRQYTNKIVSDSIAYQTALQNLNITSYQYNRADSLYKKGLKSLTYLEGKRLKRQQADNYRVKAENNWLNTKADYMNMQIELNNINVKYESDINKIQSSIFTSTSNRINAETELKKLEIQYSNYQYRTGQYFITSPQNGYVTKIKVGGKNETLKAGQEILTLMPKDNDLVVEIYVDPVDLPLMQIGQKVRIQFDGWPAIVFSGWPNVSHGTYGGEVYAIDRYISENGKYRLLVKPSPDDYPWPKALRYGGGASSMIMLNDVPIWYELWRKINGFPPNFYTTKVDKSSTKKTSK